MNLAAMLLPPSILVETLYFWMEDGQVGVLAY